jgi:NAD(P)-dependent dehydrogenase (short-subunit alcohol dehydrogenase family)
MAQAEIRFDGRAILVTGAGRGMGRTHALLLASRGAKLIIADNGSGVHGEGPGEGPAESVVAEIKAAGGEAVACTADLATEVGSNQAVEATLNAFGRIDGLLHNASTVPDLVTTDRLSSRDLEGVLRINTFAGLWMARAAWSHMVNQKYGRILYTTSVGIYGSAGTAPYCAAKAASIGIMRCLALEGVEHGILVNVVAPSARTRMTERHLTAAYADWLFKTMPPEKVSVGVAYLMSEACTINGEIFAMGGGRIGRLVIGENVGVMGSGTSIEEVQDTMPRVMADTNFFYPKDVAERSTRVASLFGFKGS